MFKKKIHGDFAPTSLKEVKSCPGRSAKTNYYNIKNSEHLSYSEHIRMKLWLIITILNNSVSGFHVRVKNGFLNFLDFEMERGTPSGREKLCRTLRQKPNKQEGFYNQKGMFGFVKSHFNLSWLTYYKDS